MLHGGISAVSAAAPVAAKETVEGNDFKRASTVNLSGELTVKWIQTNKSVDYINNLTVCK